MNKKIIAAVALGMFLVVTGTALYVSMNESSIFMKSKEKKPNPACIKRMIKKDFKLILSKCGDKKKVEEIAAIAKAKCNTKKGYAKKRCMVKAAIEKKCLEKYFLSYYDVKCAAPKSTRRLRKFRRGGRRGGRRGKVIREGK